MTLKPVQFKFRETVRPKLTTKEIRERLKFASRLSIPHLPELPAHPGRFIVVGAGPMLVDFVDEIEVGPMDVLCSLNGAHDFLIKHGIVPSIHILAEDDTEDVTASLGGPIHPGVVYYVSSSCSPDVFKQLENDNRVLWHSLTDDPKYGPYLDAYFPGEFAVGFVGLTFFRSLAIGRILGYRNFELYGCDGSVRDEQRYLPGYKTPNTEDSVTIWGTTPEGAKKEFKTFGSLAFQTDEFLKLCQNNPDINIRIHGDGLMKYVHKAWYPHQYSEERS